MDFISSYDLAKLILPPIVIYLLKKLIDLFIRIITTSQATQKYHFSKITLDRKVETLNKINELVAAEKMVQQASPSHITVQIKLLYEQIGINMPVTISHQLIAYLACNNINSYDIRLTCFLKNPFMMKYTDNSIQINKEKLNRSYYAYTFLWFFYTVSFFCAWWISVKPFMMNEAALYFVIFSFIYFIAELTITIYMIFQIEETWLGSKFAMSFEEWIRKEMRILQPESTRIILIY